MLVTVSQCIRSFQRNKTNSRHIGRDRNRDEGGREREVTHTEAERDTHRHTEIEREIGRERDGDFKELTYIIVRTGKSKS